MIADLQEDHALIIRHLREDQAALLDEYRDNASNDYLIGLIQTHQEMAWMLRAMLEGDSIG